MNAALKWWIQTAIIVFSAFMINQYGWWEFLYNADMTKISFVIIGVFLISSLSIGFISLKSTNWDHIDRLTNYVWFGSEIMVTLGMIGTVAGFLIMLNTAFTGLDVNDIKNVQEAISDMAIGMSTALVTTLVGLVCSTIIKIQMIIYENT
jgi:hypothetical protein|tara:strand:- start:1361 stop:1810 length:450 start_codon:yes stop_codon:yes gene_type:complete